MNKHFDVLAGDRVLFWIGLDQADIWILERDPLDFRRHELQAASVDYIAHTSHNFVIAVIGLNDILGVVPPFGVEG